MSHVHQIGSENPYIVVVSNSALALSEHPERFETILEDIPSEYARLDYRSDLTKTSNYTITNEDFGTTVKCNGTFNVTLPTAVGRINQTVAIKNIGLGVITLLTTSSQTIDGESSETLNNQDVLNLQSDGSDWILI